MCGRFTLIADPDLIQTTFLLDSVPQDMAPRFNIAPTQPVLVRTNEGERRAEWMRWGLIPPWAKDASLGNKLINARADTLAEKPSFRNAFRKRRCLIFADGFYEWQKVGSDKRPIYIRLDDGEPFAMAGLWEVWKIPLTGEWVRSCTIVTTGANAFMSEYHHRMPVILDPMARDAWLSPEDLPPEALMPYLEPYFDNDAMSAYEVSRLVNNPANEVPECIVPVEQPNRLM
jgi:putative SOS response-associated peptidase YedK